VLPSYLFKGGGGCWGEGCTVGSSW